MHEAPNIQVSPGRLNAPILGVVILCWTVYLDGFALVFGNSGKYIGQALQHYVGCSAFLLHSKFLMARVSGDGPIPGALSAVGGTPRRSPSRRHDGLSWV